MIKQGQRVTEMTRKDGQVGRVGTVKALHDMTVEVKWEDGHTSVISRVALRPAGKQN